MFEPAANNDVGGAAEGAESADLPKRAERMYRAAYALCYSRKAAEDLVQDDQAVAFVDRITTHLAHGLRLALLREQTSAGLADREPDARA